MRVYKMDKLKCLTIDIFRGTTHDGPGMRTTVFIKGCPMHCLWCQNPESINLGQDIWWEERKCIGCFACKKACPEGAVISGEKGMEIDRSKCSVCGACADACPSQAMSFTGKEFTIEQLVDETTRDKDYYEAFGGGVTVSGGEPLSKYEFLAEFFRQLKEMGISTALDTCGMAPAAALDSVLPFTDHVLYDIKIMNPELHREYTGQSNQVILNNLLYIADYIRRVNSEKNQGSKQEMKLWLRTPLIPDATATEENISAISRFINGNLIDVVERWELCAFNNACKSKYKKLGQTWFYENSALMGQDLIDRIKTSALSSGLPDEKLVVSGLISRE